MFKVLQFYDNVLTRRPLITRAVSTSVITLIGDVICQLGLEKRNYQTYDFQRTIKFSLVGLLFTGPSLYWWISKALPKLTTEILPRYLPFLKNGKTFPIVVTSVILDQSVWAMSFLFALFTIFDVLDHKRFDTTFKNVRAKYWDILLFNYKLWPFCQLINFTLIPFKYRVLFINLVGLVFNTYVSFAQYNNNDNTNIRKEENIKIE